MKTNKILFILPIFAIFLIGANITFAQTATNPPSFWGGISTSLQSLGLSDNPTNYAAATFVGKSLSGNQWSAGLLVIENVNNNIGVCAGIDTLWGGGKIGSANIVAGGLTLKEPTHPLKFISSDTNSFFQKIVVTPFAIAMVGTPLNGTGGADGGLASVTRAGINIDMYQFKGWQFGIGLDYGKRSGSGNYNGDWLDGSISLRHGF